MHLETILWIIYRYDRGRCWCSNDLTPLLILKDLMKKDYAMEEVWLPIDAGPDEPRCNIFISPGALQKERLVLLIQGSGAVRCVALVRIAVLIFLFL